MGRFGYDNDARRKSSDEFNVLIGFGPSCPAGSCGRPLEYDHVFVEGLTGSD